jgi:hypothetical protein
LFGSKEPDIEEGTMRANTVAALAVALGLLLTACQDAGARKENEQLKSQILQLRKDLGDMGNRVDEATAARDRLMKENLALKDENNRLKARRPGTKRPPSKRRRNQLRHRPA